MQNTTGTQNPATEALALDNNRIPSDNTVVGFRRSLATTAMAAGMPASTPRLDSGFLFEPFVFSERRRHLFKGSRVQ